uniref:Nucleolin n=1 Tax=Otolemur garnettii TaxID=30611 RepID=H0XS90_OTOGA
MVKLAKAGKNQGDPKKMAPPPKEVEEDSEDEEMSEDEDDDSSEEEAKKMVTPVKAVATPGKKGGTPGKVLVATPAKGAKNGKNAKKEDSDDDEEDDSDEDDDEEEDDDEDEEEDEFEPAVMKAAAAAPASEDEDDEDDEDEDDEDDDEDEDEDDEDEEEEEEEEEEEPVKEAPGKRKKEMMKQKAAPEAKKQKVEGLQPSLLFGGPGWIRSHHLRIFIMSYLAWNTCVAFDLFTKFGYVDFESAEDLEKALELTGLKVFGNEIKLEKPKGKDSKKDRDARTLLAKNLPYKVTQDELKEVFEDAMDIRIVSKDGKSKGIAYIEFKTEADAEKTFEEKQGTEIDGRSISLYYTGEKGQNQDYRGGKNSTWSGESKTLVLSNLSYSATEETLQEVFEKATFIKVPQNQNGKSKGYAFIEFASFEDAKEALNSCNKREIEGRAIRLELQAPRGSPNARSQPSKTLFVKGLSEDTTEETLKESFDGSVRARIVTDRETGSSKGFGFVDFNSEEDAKAAKEAMEDGEIDGNKVTLDWAKPKGEGGFGGRGGGRGGRGGGRGGRGGFGGRGRGGFGGRGGFRGGRGGGDHKPQGKKTKFE